jgi:hypothetical protein
MLASGSAIAALNSGYHVAFLFGAIFAAAAGVLGGLLLRPGQQGGADAHAHDAAASEQRRATGNEAATENY